MRVQAPVVRDGSLELLDAMTYEAIRLQTGMTTGFATVLIGVASVLWRGSHAIWSGCAFSFYRGHSVQPVGHADTLKPREAGITITKCLSIPEGT